MLYCNYKYTAIISTVQVSVATYLSISLLPFSPPMPVAAAFFCC